MAASGHSSAQWRCPKAQRRQCRRPVVRLGEEATAASDLVSVQSYGARVRACDILRRRKRCEGTCMCKVSQTCTTADAR